MKIQGVLILVLSVASVAEAGLSARVCLADGVTPLALADPNVPHVYRDIMVGTKLTIIVSSDSDGSFDSCLFITEEYRNQGVLSARDYNEATGDWSGSRFEAAGEYANVYEHADAVRGGFDLYGHRTAVAGDWFIIDYQATGVGDCGVEFYQYVDDRPHPPKMYEICTQSFFHIPTRDFSGDTQVDSGDLAVLAAHWLRTNCVEPDWCRGTDLDMNGALNAKDFTLFADYWLQTTDFHARTRDFNADTRVDSGDLAILALRWQGTNCVGPEWCQGTDLDADGKVAADDLMLFADYWLQTTEK
ncbi:MAG: hypothetical protein JSU70_09985 [Phycisphaerales bacterium]|nr:MAG: hypothetical protein JSU70_09985 [Phycisphaerales bacterium]